MLASLLLASLLVGARGRADEHDLARAHRTLHPHAPAMTPPAWRSGPEAVWALERVELAPVEGFVLETGPASLVVGHDGGAALWAVVLPEEPGRLSCDGPGDGEAVRSVYLRLHPARLGELFPAATVRGRGPALAGIDGRRVFGRKVGSSWQNGGRPVVPPEGTLVVDVETDAARRFHMLDLEAGEDRYEAYFERFPVPPPTALEPARAAASFDVVWSAFDENYPGFGLLPDLDWQAARDRWRPLAERADSAERLAGVLAELLEELGDLHAWVAVGQEFTPMERPVRHLNGSYRATGALVGGLRDEGCGLAWGRTADGIGYLGVHGLTDSRLPAAFDAALEELADAWGLVVDLRFNGGGNELLGRELAGRFLEEPVAYSSHRYRAGPDHDDLGPVQRRVCEPRGPWRHAAALVVLQGPWTMSSAESLAAMLSLAPGAVTRGAPTAGSSGNPTQLELQGGVRVSLPRWLDLGPDGEPLERRGLAPGVAVDAAPESFTDREDPVLSAALEALRARPAEERRAGRRD